MKNEQVLIKLSKEEKSAFKKASELSGMGFSAWARLRLDRSPSRVAKEVQP